MTDNYALNENELANVSGGWDEQLTNYTVRQGDTLKSIADHFGTKTGILLEINPFIDDSLTVTPGQKLQVPVRSK